MGAIWSLVRNDLRLNIRQIIWGLIIGILGTGIFYLTFAEGMSLLLPRIEYIDIKLYFAASLIILTDCVMALIVAQASTARQFFSGQMANLRSANISVSKIYVGKSLVYFCESLIYLIFITIEIMVLTGMSLSFGRLLLFWLFMIFGIYLAVQVGMLLGMMTNLRFQWLILFLLILPLLFLSGFIVPAHYWNSTLAFVISILPTTCLIENGKLIMTHRPVNPLGLIYLLTLNVVFIFGGVFLFKRKLMR